MGMSTAGIKYTLRPNKDGSVARSVKSHINSNGDYYPVGSYIISTYIDISPFFERFDLFIEGNKVTDMTIVCKAIIHLNKIRHGI